MNEIRLNFNIQEINLLLKALGQLPYHQVHELISKMHGQASQQLNHTNGHEKSAPGNKE